MTIFLLFICCISSASELSIPPIKQRIGIKVSQKKGFPGIQPILFLRWMDYKYNSGGVALWPNAVNGLTYPATESYCIKQAEENTKPIINNNSIYSYSNMNLSFSFKESKLQGSMVPWSMFVRMKKTSYGLTTGLTKILLIGTYGPRYIRTDDSDLTKIAGNYRTAWYISNAGFYDATDCVTGFVHIPSSTTSGTLKYYKNGSQYGSEISTTGQSEGYESFPAYQILGYSGGLYAVNAYVKYIAMFNKELSSSEVKAISDYLMSLP